MPDFIDDVYDLGKELNARGTMWLAENFLFPKPNPVVPPSQRTFTDENIAELQGWKDATTAGLNAMYNYQGMGANRLLKLVRGEEEWNPEYVDLRGMKESEDWQPEYVNLKGGEFNINDWSSQRMKGTSEEELAKARISSAVRMGRQPPQSDIQKLNEGDREKIGEYIANRPPLLGMDEENPGEMTMDELNRFINSVQSGRGPEVPKRLQRPDVFNMSFPGARPTEEQVRQEYANWGQGFDRGLIVPGATVGPQPMAPPKNVDLPWSPIGDNMETPAQKAVHQEFLKNPKFDISSEIAQQAIADTQAQSTGLSKSPWITESQRGFYRDLAEKAHRPVPKQQPIYQYDRRGIPHKVGEKTVMVKDEAKINSMTNQMIQRELTRQQETLKIEAQGKQRMALKAMDVEKKQQEDAAKLEQKKADREEADLKEIRTRTNSIASSLRSQRDRLLDKQAKGEPARDMPEYLKSEEALEAHASEVANRIYETETGRKSKPRQMIEDMKSIDEVYELIKSNKWNSAIHKDKYRDIIIRSRKEWDKRNPAKAKELEKALGGR